MKAETGTCRASFEKWYFNVQTGKCETFVYGGCDGNGNNFASKEDCEGFCGVVAPREESTKPDCTLSSEVGPCRYYFLTL